MRAFAGLCAVTLGFGCTVAAGSDFNPLGFYLGGAAGRSDVKTTLPMIVEPESSFDERSTGWKALAGIRPIRILAAEIAYIDLGHQNSDTYPGNYHLHANVRQHATTLSGLLYLPIPVPRLDIYGRAGVARLESSGSSYSVCTGIIGVCPLIAFAPPPPFSRTDSDLLCGTLS